MSRPSGVTHWQLDGWRTLCGCSVKGKTDAPIRLTGEHRDVTCLRCIRGLRRRGYRPNAGAGR